MLYDYLEERFWSKVDIKGPNDCWEWKAANSRGYGQFLYKGKLRPAHAVIFESLNGPIPEGKIICHKCNNKICVNPIHLYCGTYQDNRRDMDIAHPISAESFGTGRAKLNEDQIKSIREFKEVVCVYNTRKSYKYSLSYIANLFSVNPSTIKNIWDSNVWLANSGRYI